MLPKHQFRGNFKIKNSWISSKRLVGIKINLSQKNLPSFLDQKPLPELLKTFSSIWSTIKMSVYTKCALFLKGKKIVGLLTKEWVHLNFNSHKLLHQPKIVFRNTIWKDFNTENFQMLLESSQLLFKVTTVW